MTSDSSATRRLFGEELPTRTGFIACEIGVARVSLAGGRVGHAGLVKRCTATSVATDGTQVVVGTVRGVFVDEGEGFERRGDPFEVAAVGIADGRPLAAGEDGLVLAWDGELGWRAVGEVTGPQRFDGSLLAAGDGVYRVTDELDRLGLAGVHDVADGETCFAASEDGIYRRAEEGWQVEHERPAAVVITGASGSHAVDDRHTLTRVDGAWDDAGTPVLPVDLGDGDTLCAITADGRVLVRGERGDWRSNPLGLRGVVEFVITQP